MNRYMTACLAAAMALSVAGLSACSPRQQPVSQQAPPAEPVPEAVQSESTPVEPAPEPEPETTPPKPLPQPDPALLDAELESIFFSGVEKWEAGLPVGWSSDADRTGVEQKDAGRRGQNSVQLNPTEGWAYIARNFESGETFEPGGDYVIDAYLKMAEPEAATLRFVCFAGEDRYEAEVTTGGELDEEGWERLVLPVTVPASLTVDRYQIRIFRSPGGEEPLYVDDVSAWTPSAGEPEGAEDESEGAEETEDAEDDAA